MKIQQAVRLSLLPLAFCCADPQEPVSWTMSELCSAQSGAPATGEVLLIDVGAGGGEEDEGDEGGEGDEDGGGYSAAEGYLSDGPYDAERGFGWLGEAETAVREAWYVEIFTLGTSSDANLHADAEGYHEQVAPYRSWVTGLSGYRVDVADGLWDVTLLLMEPEYPEAGLRLFDISSQGELLVSGLDIAALAGQDEIAAITLRVASDDGTLQLDFTSSTDAPPVLAGLRLAPAALMVPAEPGDLQLRAGAGELLLRWDLHAQPVRGWLVERSQAGGAWEQATPQLLPAPFWADLGRSAGESLAYRVRAVSPGCTAGIAAATTNETVLDAEDFGLPVVDLELDPQDLIDMHRAPAEKLEVPVLMSSGDEQGSGTIHLRGASTLWLSKRSFSVELDSGTIDGRDHFKLLAELPDPTRLWQLLAFDLLERMGALASQARPVLLRVNGQNYGVYDDVEHVGDEFLTTRGYSDDGDRFRLEGSTFQLSYDDSGAVDLSAFEKKENETEASPELEALLVWLNTAGEHEVAEELGSYLDTDVLLDYLAGQQLFANYDVVDGGHYLVHDADEDRFLMVPWDLNNDTWGQSELALCNHSFYALGAEPSSWQADWLWSRAMGDPAFRGDLAERLAELLDGPFAQDSAAAVDSLYAQLEPALQAEPWIWRRRYESWLAAGPTQIQDFIAARREHLATTLGEFAQLGETGLVLSEIVPGADPSVVLENRGELEVALESCWVSDEPFSPQAVSLAELGGVEPGERLELVPGDLTLSLDGGFVSLSCGQEEGGWEGDETDEDEASVQTLLSFVVYPALGENQSYQRTNDQWEVSTSE